jgi:hypothetical protein
MSTEDDDIPSSTPPSARLAQAMITFMEPLLPALEIALKSIDDPARATEPRTQAAALTRRMEDAFETTKPHIDTAKFFEAFLLVTHGAFKDFPLEARRTEQRYRKAFLAQFGSSPAYQALQQLTAAAESASQGDCNATLSLIDEVDIARKSELAFSLLHPLDSLTGETRAEQAMRAWKRVSETLYQPYVRVLHSLFRILQGTYKSTIAKMKYGSVHDELLNASFASLYGMLLEPDAVLVRNAEAHERWDYHPAPDEVEVHDSNKPPKRISVSDLIRRTDSMITLSAVMLPGHLRLRKLSATAAYCKRIGNAWSDLFSTDSNKQLAAVELLTKEHGK